MGQRSWEPMWDAYKSAEDEYRQAVEKFRRSPSGDVPTHEAVLSAGRKRNEAWETFREAFDSDSFRAK